eukprot:494696-Alexandrium_andersonii.AAC.1
MMLPNFLVMLGSGVACPNRPPLVEPLVFEPLVPDCASPELSGSVPNPSASSNFAITAARGASGARIRTMGWALR